MQQGGRGSVTSHFRRPTSVWERGSASTSRDCREPLLDKVGREKEQTSKNPDRPASDAALREYCDKHYHQLLPIIAKKVLNEKVQQEKLKEVKARLNFEGCSRKTSKIQEVSQHSESRTLNSRDLRRRLKSRRSRSTSRSLEPTSRKKFVRTFKKPLPGFPSTEKEPLSESGDSEGGHWKSKLRKQRSSIEEEDLSQPWTCEEADPFTPRIRYFELLKKSRMPNNVKTYDGCDYPEDHLKIFQEAAKSIDSYDDLKKAFLANYLQQKKCIKDPIKIHHIKQREGKSTEDFVQRFKAKSRHVKGAPECMRISRFMHGITNPELIKCLHDNIPKSVDNMTRVTTAFLRGEVAASNQARKKATPIRKQQVVGRKQNFDRMGDFKNQQRSNRRRDKFTLLTKSPKEILALDKGKFKATPPMTTLVEKRNSNKFCRFHGEVRHNTDECMHLKRQIEELIKNGKLSQVIRELKQGSGKDRPKTTKRGKHPERTSRWQS
ncbi:reverse transcriptase domain-containing protein [Tanacetum coccineum]